METVHGIESLPDTDCLVGPCVFGDSFTAKAQLIKYFTTEIKRKCSCQFLSNYFLYYCEVQH